MKPKISFGIIVLNGEPFTKYCLRQIYPFAHQILVIEGGSEYTRAQAPNGRSIDGTIESLEQFKAEEDPENKITITHGLWTEKDEQAQAYTDLITGDYLWQVDIDEFYKNADIRKIIDLLGQSPQIDGIGFKWQNFWGSFETLVDSYKIRASDRIWKGNRRIFKWGKRYHLVTHRPPTVIDDRGRDLSKKNWISGNKMAKKGIYCYHYGMIFGKSAKQKTSYYGIKWKSHKDMRQWYEKVFINLNDPFRIQHGTNMPSWLRKYTGSHPEQIQLLCDEINKSGILYNIGNKPKIDTLLSSPLYRCKSKGLAFLEPITYFINYGIKNVR
jgi:hypothetical protein